MSEASGGGEQDAPSVKKKKIASNNNLNWIDEIEIDSNESMDSGDRGVRSILSNTLKDNAIHSMDINIKNNEDSDKKIETLFYKNNNLGPFIVIVEATENSGNYIGRFNHLKIAKEVFDLQLKDIVKIKPKGINKIGVQFKNKEAANNFVNNEYIKEKGYKIYIPFNQVTCKGIVRRIDKIFSEKDLEGMIGSPYRISNIKRMNRREKEGDNIQYKPTNTILITFEGVILPRHIDLCYMNYEVITYIPPVTWCFNCLIYGHVKKQCKGKKKCFSCSEIHNSDEEYNECSEMKCIHCKEKNHKSNDKNCIEFKRQKSIREKMTYSNLSFFEASLLFPKQQYENIIINSNFPELEVDNTQTDSNSIQINERQKIIHNENIAENKKTYNKILKQSDFGKKERILIRDTILISIEKICFTHSGKHHRLQEEV
ncbi:uncharacterized protein [Leptinotarsa decemlineata]|uniref:uncharacterized protein n=1 Tax=Leptinotarsa decemlineata TaxID=7539 RepID=UPI003D306585